MPRVLSLTFPTAGLNRAAGFQTQPPWSSPDCRNVRPRETLTGRGRGGSRPGLGDHFGINAASGAIRMLNAVNLSTSSGWKNWSDYFDGTALKTDWTVASWIGTLPSIFDGSAMVYTNSAGMVLANPSDFDATQPYGLSLTIAPYHGVYYGTHVLYFRMDDTTPNAVSNCCRVAFTISATAYSITLYKVVAGVETVLGTPYTGTGDIGTMPWTFSVYINGTSGGVYWNGALRTSGTLPAAAGKRVGVGLFCVSSPGVVLATGFNLTYKSTGGEHGQQTVLIGSDASNFLISNPASNSFATITSTLKNATDRAIQSAVQDQLLYVADYTTRKNGSDGTMTTGVLTATSVSNWTLLGIDKDQDVVTLVKASSGAATNCTITTVASGGLTLASPPVDGADYTWRVERAPKIVTPTSTGSVARWTATAGVLPTGCPCICSWRDRIVLAGGPDAPQAWYMSRMGDPKDWDYGQEDPAAAVAGTQFDGGQLSAPVTALIPHSNDYLVIATSESLFILRGDPADQGQLDCLTRNVGVVGRFAWCYGPDGSILFLSQDGLYALAPGYGQFPQSISRERLPQELIGLRGEVFMAYDVKWRGVHIYTDTGMHWWVDWTNKSFWPVTFNGFIPTALLSFTDAVNPNLSGVLIGDNSGQVVRYDDRNESDKSLQIESYVILGPIRASNDSFNEGVILQLKGTLANDSGPVDWAILEGSSNENAASGQYRAYGTWTAGPSLHDHPKSKSSAFSLKLSNTTSKRAWAYELCMMVVDKCGKDRAL